MIGDDSSSGSRTGGAPKSAPLRVTRKRVSSSVVLVGMPMGVEAMLVAGWLLGVLVGCCGFCVGSPVVRGENGAPPSGILVILEFQPWNSSLEF